MIVSSEHTKKALEALHPNIAVFRHPDHVLGSHDVESTITSSLENLRINAPKIASLSDDAVRGLYGIKDDVILYWAHHEKLCLIDSKIAFMGGLDLCFGRWDTYQHAITDVHPTDLNEIVFPGQDYNNARVMDFENVQHWDQNQLDRKVTSRMGWSDISVCLRGPVVEDLRRHFVDRWNFIYDVKYLAQKNSRYSKLVLYGRPSSSVGQHPGGPLQGPPVPGAPSAVSPPLESHPPQPGWKPQGSLSAPFVTSPGAGTGPPGGQGGLSSPQPAWSPQAGSQPPLAPSPGGQYNNPYSGQQLPPPPPGPPPPRQEEPGYQPQHPQGHSPTPTYPPSGQARPPPQPEPEYRPQNPQGPQGIQGDYSPSPTYSPSASGQARPPPPQQAEPEYRPQGSQGIQGDYSPTPTYTPSGPPPSGPPPPQQAEPGYRPYHPQGPHGDHSSTPTYDHPPQHGQIPYFPPPPPSQDTYQPQTGSSEYDHYQGDGARGIGSDHDRSLKDDLTGLSSTLRSQLAGQVHHYQDRLAGHRPPAPHGQGPQGSGSTSCQIVRSCTKWSHGVPTEHSVADAYAAIIRESQHFIYIENQFFITATSDAQKPVENKIGAAIVERILRAARAGQRYKIIVVIPSVPGFAGDLHDESALGTRAIMNYQYNAISRGGHSILELVAKEGYNPLDYIRFYNLRNYDRINVSRSLFQVEQRSGVDYEEARRQHDYAEVGPGGYGAGAPPGGPGASAVRGFDTTAPSQEYQATAQQISASIGSVKGRWDTVSECYMLGGEDIRNVPWDSDIPEIDAFVSEELYIHTKVRGFPCL